MSKTNLRLQGRLRRKKHIQKTVRGSEARPRLSVFRSARHIYAQIIDDTIGETLASASTLSAEVGGLEDVSGKMEASKRVGALIAEKAKAAGIEQVCFDRNGYLYHGRVKALADAAREGGLNF